MNKVSQCRVGFGTTDMMKRSSTNKLLTGTFLMSFIGMVYFTGRGVDRRVSQVEAIQGSPDTEESVIVDPKTASVADVLRYFRWTNSTSCILTHYFGGRMTKWVYHGFDGQKAVCLDAGLRPEPGKCIIYSFGINNEWSFDDDMDDYDCQIYAFDPSMNTASHNRSDRIHFFNVGLAAANSNRDSHGWKVKNLRSIYEMLKPWHGEDAVIDYFKADIEMAEWEVIPDMIASGMLDKIKQIGFELHLFGLETEEQFREKYAIVRMLEEHGMVRFDSKGNIFLKQQVRLAPGGYARTGYEIAWYNPKFYQHEYV